MCGNGWKNKAAPAKRLNGKPRSVRVTRRGFRFSEIGLQTKQTFFCSFRAQSAPDALPRAMPWAMFFWGFLPVRRTLYPVRRSPRKAPASHLTEQKSRPNATYKSKPVPSPQHPAFPPSKDGEKCSKCRFSKCVKTLTASCKRGENVLSLCSEKRGYAPRAYPLFCSIEYQRLTKPEDVHVAPPGCTCRKNSKYSRRSGAYFRGEKPPFCPAIFLSRSREAMVYS